MLRGLARFKELGIELSGTVVVVDYLPKTSRVKEKLHELIETKYSGTRREPKSLNVCEFDQTHMLAWVEFMDIVGENSSMRRFVRELNYECFMGNILTVSVVKDMKVIYGHEESCNFPRSPVRVRNRSSSYSRYPKHSSPRPVQRENQPGPSRTELLREILPSMVPTGRILGSKQIRYIARDKQLCYVCLKPGHTHAECPTGPRFSSSSHRQVSETRVSGLQIHVQNEPSSRRSFDESWDDPPPKPENSNVYLPTVKYQSEVPPLMSLPAVYRPSNDISREPRLGDLRRKALESRNIESESPRCSNVVDKSVCAKMSRLPISPIPDASFLSEPVTSPFPRLSTSKVTNEVSLSELSTSSSSKSVSSTSSLGAGYYVPTRLEYARKNNLYFSDDDESMSDAVRYPLSVLGETQEERDRLSIYRANRRRWWRECCDYDTMRFRYISPNPSISTDDPYWSQKVGLESEPSYKTADQWSRSQLPLRVDGWTRVRLKPFTTVKTN